MRVYDLELAWRAGIFDGEGCICISRNNSRPTQRGEYAHSLIINLSNTSEEAHKPFLAHYGGIVTRHNGRLKNWICPRASKEQFLRDLLPYLRVKTEQAQLALQFLALPIEKHNGKNSSIKVIKERMLLMMQKLNHPNGGVRRCAYTIEGIRPL